MSRRIYSRHTLVVIAVVALAVFLLYQTYARVAGDPTSVASSFFLGLGLPVVISIAALIATPFRKDVETSFVYFFDALRGGACRVFVFGRSRTGKTTLVADLVAIDRSKRRPPTPDFVIYELKAALELGPVTKYINLRISDYRGEDPAQVIINQDPFFLGHVEAA